LAPDPEAVTVQLAAVQQVAQARPGLAVRVVVAVRVVLYSLEVQNQG
jgi:hypothetical protein